MLNALRHQRMVQVETLGGLADALEDVLNALRHQRMVQIIWWAVGDSNPYVLNALRHQRMVQLHRNL